MLKYSSVVGAIYEYKNRFPAKNGASRISSDDLDIDYILLDNSSYIDKSSLSKRRNDKMNHPGVKDEYRSVETAAELIRKYKSSIGLNARLDEKAKAAIIAKLHQIIASDSEIDERSKYFIDCLSKTETFPEFFAACLILAIIEEPLQDIWKDLSNTRKEPKERTADLISLTPDFVFFNEIIGRDDLIEDILFGLNTKNRRIQLTGMGGIGKTEVLRAAYSYLQQHSDEHSFDYIGFLNYTGDVNAMLAQQMYCPDDPSSCASIEYLRQLSRRGNILLFIDDLHHELSNKGVLSAEDSPFDELLNLNISIVLASRALIRKDRFKPLRVRPLSTTDCIRIFQKERNRNFEGEIDDGVWSGSSDSKLESNEKELLSAIIEKRAGRNTLVVKRLGAIACNYGWSIAQLNQELIRKDFNICRGLSLMDGEYSDDKTLQDEINKLYDFKEIKSYDQQNILEGFSKLASAPLDMDTCALWFAADAGVDENKCRLIIADLARRTWLQTIRTDKEKATLAYSMHMIVKSAVRSQTDVRDENHENLIKQAWGEIKLEARLEDIKEWSDEIKAARGDRVRFRIHFLNTGKEIMRNVCFRAILPTGIVFEPGTVEVYNVKHPKGVSLSDLIVTDVGMNIGDYAPGGGAYIYFWARVDDIDKAKNICCRVSAETNGGYITKADTVDILVNAAEQN